MKVVFAAFWPSINKFRWLAVTIMFLVILTVSHRAGLPFLLKYLVEALVQKDNASVTLILWIFVAMLITANVIWFIYDMVISTFELKVMQDLNKRNFEVIQAQSMRFFEDSFSGSLVTSARRFRNSFEIITDACCYQLGRSIVLIVLTLVIFACTNLFLAFVFGIWAIIFLAVSVFIAKLRIKRDAIAAEKDSAVSGVFADSFSNESTVKSFGMERSEQKRFDSVADDSYWQYLRAWTFGVVLIRVQGLICATFEFLVIFILALGWQKGKITMAEFVFFQTYVLLLVYQVWDFGNTMHKVFRNIADAKEMAEVYIQKPEVQDSPNARPLNIEEGEIEFHAVNFSYINRETKKHHDVNNFTLRILQGQSIALVGHTGAGKSTLVKLLLRYFDLNSGYIRIDRQDIANVTQVSLRQQIAVVPQQPELFHRTLRENIAFAKPDASDEEIAKAAKRAFAWDFITAFPKEFNTLVGERGVKLSGGERQRIALARAFLADAPILVLDEATSALDSKTEHQIQLAIADLLEGRTCIVIAHRLSTIQRADRIIVMEKGSVVEEGTHSELLDNNGVYADLWLHQSGGYIKD